MNDFSAGIAISCKTLTTSYLPVLCVTTYGVLTVTFPTPPVADIPAK